MDEVVTLTVPAAVAQHRLRVYFHADDGLPDVSSAAFADGRALLLRAGFAGVTKRVAVQHAPPYLRGDTTVVPLRWVATGPVGELFPAMDANLELDPAPDGTCRLTFRGSYRPPLGAAGTALDGLLLHAAGRATARSFLARVAALVTQLHPAPATHPQAAAHRESPAC